MIVVIVVSEGVINVVDVVVVVATWRGGLGMGIRKWGRYEKGCLRRG